MSVSDQGLIDKISDKVEDLLYGRARKERHAGQDAATTDVIDFDERLHEFLAGRKLVVAGQLQLVGLDNIRARFGDRWPHVAERVHATIRLILRRRLSAKDISRRHGDFGYIVFFAEPSKEEAHRRCALIGEEIARQLVGEEFAEAAEIRSVVGVVDGKLLLERAGAYDSVAKSLADPAAAAPDGAPAPMGAKPAASSPGPAAPAADKPPRGRPRNDDNFLTIARDLTYLYRPLWSVRRDMLSTYLCQPSGKVLSPPLESGYNVLPLSAGAELFLTLDLLTLAHVDHAHGELHRIGRRALFASPVHFRTLALAGTHDAYVSGVRDIAADRRQDIVFEVVGLPVSIGFDALSAVVGPMKSAARSVIARVSLDFTRFGELRKSGLSGVGADLDMHAQTESEIICKFNSFAENAGRAGLRSFLHGVRSTSLGTAAICAGFDYIDGDAVATALGKPDQATRFKSEELFSHLMPEKV